MRFKRKHCVVHAVQWHPDVEVEGVKLTAPDRGSLTPRGILKTSRGSFIVNDGDWIVTGPHGSWVVEQDAFDDLYERADTPHSAAIDALLKELGDGRHCPQCGGMMYHSRLKGYQCNRC